MPRYLSSHNMACMTRQGARALAQNMQAATSVRFLRLLANMTDGHLIAEFEAASRQILEEWMQQARIHFERIERVDFEATAEQFNDL